MTGLLSVAGSTPSEGFELKSCRFDGAQSTKLSKTFSTAGNTKTWTLSLWTKRTELGTRNGYFMRLSASGQPRGGCRWSNYGAGKDCIVMAWNGMATTVNLTTTPAYRDVGSWYHLVFICDTTSATAADRMQIWVNGSRVTALQVSNYPNQNDSTSFNQTYAATEVGLDLDGYMAECYFIDGTALTPSSFGETNALTNQWQPKEPKDIKEAVTFGKNGFYLPFSNDALADSFEDSADHSIHTMTANGDANTDTAIKKIGTASLECTGSDGADNLSTPNSQDFMFGTGELTVEFWMYTTRSDVYQYLFGQIRSDGTDEFFMRIDNDNKIRFLVKGESSAKQCISSSTVSTSTWHHIAGVRDGDNLRLYIDGVLKDTEAFTSQSQMAPTTRFEVGATPYNSDGGHSGFAGYIDEFRLSDTCRYPSGTTFTPSTTAFTADKFTRLLLHMDGTNGGTSFPDSSWTGAPRHAITKSGNTTNKRVSNYPVAANGDAHIIGPKIGASAIAITPKADFLSLAPGTDYSFGTATNFTVEFWMNCGAQSGSVACMIGSGNSGWGTGACLIRMSGSTGPGVEMFHYDGNGSTAMLSSITQVNDDAWHHVAVVRSSTTWYMFIDGTLEDTWTGTNPSTNWANNSIMYIGKNGWDGTSGEWIGYMDEIRISNTARYTASFTPATTEFSSDGNTKLLIHSNTTMGSTTFTDSSSEANTVTNSGCKHVAPKIGTGMGAFDGSGDYLSLATADKEIWNWGTSAYTVEGWVNTTSQTSQFIWHGAGSGNSVGFRVRVQADGKINANEQVSGDHEFISSSTVDDGNWHHWAVSREQGRYAQLYIDGTLEATNSQNYNTDNTNEQYIGMKYGGNEPFNGYMDEMRVSRVARYTTNFTPSTTAFKDDKDTVLLLHMDGGGGIDPDTNLPTLAGQGKFFWDASSDAIFYGADGIPTNKSYMDFPGGGSDYLTIPASTDFDFGTGDTTIEYWTKTAQTATSRVVTRGDNPKQWFFRSDTSVASECVKTYIGSGIVNFDLRSQGELIATGSWHHLALVRTSTALRYFIDGVQKAVATVSGSWDTTSTTDVLAIGQGITSGTSEDYDGFMDQLRISNTARYGVFTPTESITADILVVAGGGGGGRTGGGGGAGGFQEFASENLTAQGYVVTVGAGGKGNNTDGGSTANGENSSFGALTASVGGGGGGAYGYTPGGNAGGSGGGGGLNTPSTPGGAGTSGQGSAGGASLAGQSPPRGTGGGGGATAAGAAGTSTSSGTGGAGGAGDTNAYQTGSNITYAGGGGGSGTYVAGAGGSGGGGAGNTGQNSPVPIFGTPGTDGLGGGGGAGFDNGGGNGGSGIVIIRYQSTTTKATGGTITTYGSGGSQYQVHTFENQLFTPPTAEFTADANTKLLVQSDFSEGGLGADHSNNYNYFTPTNLTADDMMPDSPMNNFCTMNPLAPQAHTMSEGNLWVSTSVAESSSNTFGMESGKWYFEVLPDSSSFSLGIVNDPNIRLDTTSSHVVCVFDNGGTVSTPNSTEGSDTFSSGSSGDIYGFAIDADAKTLDVYQNNTKVIEVTSFTIDAPYFFSVDRNTGVTVNQKMNFGADSSFAGTVTSQGNQDGNDKGDFYYAPPAGYLALCTDNMSNPSIALPGKHFNTLKWSGETGNVSRDFTGVGFKPDFVWGKSYNDTWSHSLNDSVRGVNKELYSNTTGPEVASPSNGYIDSFDSDGFSTIAGSSNNGQWNGLGDDFVAWLWKGDNVAGGTLNEDGSMDSQVSANTSAGFSIVSYTGTGAAATIGHGLSVAPHMIITKKRSGTEAWAVGNTTVGWTKYAILNTAAAWTTSTAYWNDTAPTASVFSVKDADETNGTVDATYIAYCFHSVEGYSQLGTYTGNAAVDGAFVYTGFRPAFIFLREYTAGDDFGIYDEQRPGYNNTTLGNAVLYPAYDQVQDQGSTRAIDILSNGFKLRTTNATFNPSSGTVMYYAIAETPFKTANAR